MSDEPNHEGIDFALEQLCAFLGVDPHMVSWDAATETVDGDVSAVIGNIMRAKYGEDFDPKASVAATPAYPSITAMTAAVELEIKSALGFATTQAIGQMIQKAMDAVAAAAATPASEAADWQYRFRDPHNGAPWGPWKRMMGSIEENRALFAGRIIGESDRDETKMAVEFRPLYPHSRPLLCPTENKGE